MGRSLSEALQELRREVKVLGGKYPPTSAPVYREPLSDFEAECVRDEDPAANPPAIELGPPGPGPIWLAYQQGLARRAEQRMPLS